jgi:hypothetical protein
VQDQTTNKGHQTLLDAPSQASMHVSQILGNLNLSNSTYCLDIEKKTTEYHTTALFDCSNHVAENKSVIK